MGSVKEYVEYEKETTFIKKTCLSCRQIPLTSLWPELLEVDATERCRLDERV